MTENTEIQATPVMPPPTEKLEDHAGYTVYVYRLQCGCFNIHRLEHGTNITSVLHDGTCARHEEERLQALLGAGSFGSMDY